MMRLLFVILALVVSMSAARGDMLFDADQFGRVDLVPKQSTSGTAGLIESLGAKVDRFEPIYEFPEDDPIRVLGRSVGRLEILLTNTAGARGTSVCTATLIDKDKIITNHHCVPGDPGSKIDRVQVRFGYLELGSKDSVAFDVEIIPIEASQQLDYAILRVRGKPGKKFGVAPLKVRCAKANERLYIIHHPAGQPQKLTRAFCRAHPKLAIDAGSLRHQCDTLPGSSGSLIFAQTDSAAVALHNLGGLAPNDASSFNQGVETIALKDGTQVFPTLCCSKPTPPSQPVKISKSDVRDDRLQVGQKTFGPDEYIQGFALEPQQNLVALSSRNDGPETLSIWDIANGQRTAVLSEGRREFRNLRWSLDGRWVYSVVNANQIIGFHLASKTEKILAKIEGPAMWMEVAGENFLAVSTNGGPALQFLELMPLKLTNVPKLEEYQLDSLDFFVARRIHRPSGTSIEAVRQDQIYKKSLQGIGVCERSFVAAISITVKQLVIADKNCFLIWDISEREPKRLIRGTGIEKPSTMAYSSDGKLLLIGSEDGVVHLWDSANWKPLRQLRGHKDKVLSVAFSLDGRFGISGGQYGDATVKVWDLLTGDAVQNFIHKPGVSVSFVSVDKDSRTAFSTHYEIKTWPLYK